MTSLEFAKEWASEKENDFIKNYERLGLRASGNWAKLLSNEVTESDSKIKIEFYGANYSQQLENGRLPNRNQDPKALKSWVGWAGSTFLKQWVADKGININPFAVAWKIAREGVKVPNTYNEGGLISDVITNESVSLLLNEMTDGMLLGIKSDIIKELK